MMLLARRLPSKIHSERPLLFNMTTVQTSTRQTFSSGAYTEVAYDSRDRIVSVAHRKGDATLLGSSTYVYANNGSLASRTDDGLTTSYTYDNADQLLSEVRPGYSAAYTYDGNGNRGTKSINGMAYTYSYDAGDKLQSVLSSSGDRLYTYDAAGRTTSIQSNAGTTAISYDYEGQITSITYPNLSTNTFTYNGLGGRVSKSDSEGSFAYVRDGARSDLARFS
jgi:YD repeat-containing protein